MQKLLALLSLLLLLASCSKNELHVGRGVQYATLLHLDQGEGYIQAEVVNPWKAQEILARYILVPKEQELPDNLPQGTLLRTPLERTVSLSSLHAALAIELGAAEKICALADTAFVVSPIVHQLLQTGNIQSVGSSMQPDKERLTALQADAILASPYEGANISANLPTKTPVVLCADYMETSALGRAEWMKFYGLLWGKSEVADSLFDAVETAYLALCQKAQQVPKRPRLICDTKEGASWPVPGGNSYLGQLFTDAGADYIFAHRPENGTAFLSLEEVIAHGLQSDVWLIKYGATTPLTYAKLSQDFPQSKDFMAYKNHNIWCCNTFRTAYYDEVPFHPERLLRDLISILHPDLLPGHEMLYYQRLSE